MRRLRPPSPPLSDGVVRLVPIAKRFAPDFDALASDSEVLRFTRVPRRRGDDFAEGWVDRYVRGWRNGSRAGFAIVGADDAVFLGMAGLVDIRWELAEAELGYIVAPAARGRGVALRAIRLVSAWTFDALNIARLEAWIDVANDRSARAVERAGFRFEGVRRSAHFKQGERVDMAVYSLLPGELR